MAGQTARLEALYLSGRRLPFAQWRERYQHPLLAGLACRLIWRFDAGGERIDGLPRNAAQIMTFEHVGENPAERRQTGSSDQK